MEYYSVYISKGKPQVLWRPGAQQIIVHSTRVAIGG
jgi:hypothetical protein